MNRDIRFEIAAVVFAALVLGLSGCNTDGSGSTANPVATTNGNTTTTNGNTTSSPVVVPPSINGTPPASIAAGSAYKFQPTVTAAAGAELSFSIANQPTWAQFDPTTGKLSGTPKATDVGVYGDISIKANDGTASASLQPFSIAVTPSATTMATITWAVPIEGPTVTPVAGYHVYYGASAAEMTHIVNISNPAQTSYVTADLGTGMWYFAMTSYDADQVESVRSATVAVTL